MRVFQKTFKPNQLALLLSTAAILSVSAFGGVMAEESTALDNCSSTGGDIVCTDQSEDEVVERIRDEAQDAVQAVIEPEILQDAVAETDLQAVDDSLTQEIDEILAGLDPEVREIIQNSLTAYLTRLRENYDEDLENGLSEEEARENLLSDLRGFVENVNEIPGIATEITEDILATDPDDPPASAEETTGSLLDRFMQQAMGSGAMKFSQLAEGGGLMSNGSGAMLADSPTPSWGDVQNSTGDGKISAYEIHHKERITDGDIRGQHAEFTKIWRDWRNQEQKAVDPKLLVQLDNIQAMFEAKGYTDVYFNVTSPYRSPESNEKAKGAKKSAHMQAMAADTQIVANLNGRQKTLPRNATWSAACVQSKIAGLGGVGRYDDNDSVHIDSGSRRNWACGFSTPKRCLHLKDKCASANF